MSWGSPVIDPGHTVVLHVWSKAPPGCSDHLRVDGECWWAAFLIYVQTTFQRDGVKGRIPIKAWPRPLRACACTSWRDTLRVQPPQPKTGC